MSDSRSRFFKWAYDQQKRPQDHTEWALEIWAAAEAETARRCLEIVRQWEYSGTYQSDAIKAEFPEVFK